MRQIVWESDALDDLESAVGFVAAGSQQAADRLELRVLETLDLLAAYPIGRPSRMVGASEKLVLKTPYIVTYRATENELIVLRIIHQSRQWGRGEWPKG